MLLSYINILLMVKLCYMYLIVLLTIRRSTRSTLFPYTTLFRSHQDGLGRKQVVAVVAESVEGRRGDAVALAQIRVRSEEHTSELQSPVHLVCRLLLEKKKLLPINILLIANVSYKDFKTAKTLRC